MALEIVLDHQFGRAPAQLPGGRRRHRAAVDRVEVPPGRQHLGPAAGRRTTGSGRHAPAVQPGEQARQLVGPAGLNRRAQPPVDRLEHGTGRGPAGLRRCLARHQSARQELQPLHRVALRAPGAGTRQHGGTGSAPGLAQYRPERVPLQLEIGRECPQQRGLAAFAPAARGADQCHQEIGKLPVRRGLAEDVQPVADLQLLDLAQMVVDAGELVGIVRLDAEIAGQTQGMAALEDPLAQMDQSARVECRGFLILVHQCLEGGQLAPALRPGHRRCHVVDDHRIGAPLGLGALARIVDDERIEVRHGPQDRLGQAVHGECRGLARQPFEVAVLAQMDDRMGVEAVAQPEVEGEIAVRRRQVRGVVGGVRVDVVAARGLKADDDTAEAKDRQGKRLADHVRVGLGLAPALLDPRPHACGQGGVVAAIVDEAQRDGDTPSRASGQLVGGTCRQPRHQLGPVGREVGQAVAGLCQGLQHQDAARRYVQAHAVGQSAVPRRIVGEHDGEIARRGRGPAQPRPGSGQRRQMRHAVRHRAVAGEDGLSDGIALPAMLERDRDRTDPAVDLGQGHMHGEIARTQAALAGTPGGLATAGKDRLQDGSVGGGKRVVGTGAVDGADGKGGSVQDHVGAKARYGLVHQGGSGGILQARQIEAGGGEARLLQRRQQGVDRRQIAALQERAIEHQIVRPAGWGRAGRGGRGRRVAAAAARTTRPAGR